MYFSLTVLTHNSSDLQSSQVVNHLTSKQANELSCTEFSVEQIIITQMVNKLPVLTYTYTEDVRVSGEPSSFNNSHFNKTEHKGKNIIHVFFLILIIKPTRCTNFSNLF